MVLSDNYINYCYKVGLPLTNKKKENKLGSEINWIETKGLVVRNATSAEIFGKPRATKTARTIATTTLKGKKAITTTKVVGGNPQALIWRLYNFLLSNAGVTAKRLASRFKTTQEAVTATLRDLRKKGHDVQCRFTSGAYRYSIA